eukprot:1598597-Rhodomonas_salina.1
MDHALQKGFDVTQVANRGSVHARAPHHVCIHALVCTFILSAMHPGLLSPSVQPSLRQRIHASEKQST